MNYEETMNYITCTAKFGSNYGLERTEKILELLGNPHKELKCIHIAGTNGKGSTTAMLNNILLNCGYKVGMYVSPYLEEFEERIQINNVNIPKDDLCRIITKVAKAVVEVVSEGYDQPTEFEIITCAMLLYFYEEKVDYAVIEVGLGGRLDSTNVITPLVSVITSISYDHMNILGNSLKEIAGEKGGIIKPFVPVVLYPQAHESLNVIEELCRKNRSKLVKVENDCSTYLRTEGNKQLIQVRVQGKIYDIKLALLGKHQLLNCAVVLHVVDELIAYGIKIDCSAIEIGLETVKWPGRLEIMNRKPMVIIDGAHNIDAILKLSESIDMYFNYNKLYLILGILADKQVESMVKIIVPKAKKVFVVTPNSERAELSTELKKVVIKYNVSCESVEDYTEAYRKAFSLCNEDDLLVISGSLYMIGDMRKIIKLYAHSI